MKQAKYSTQEASEEMLAEPTTASSQQWSKYFNYEVRKGIMIANRMKIEYRDIQQVKLQGKIR